MLDISDLKLAAWVVLAPALIAVPLLLLGRYSAKKLRTGLAAGLAGLALSAGLAAAGHGQGFLTLPSAEQPGWQWLLGFGLFAFLPGALICWSRWFWPLALGYAIAAAYFTIPNLQDLPAPRAYLMAGFAVVAWLTWATLDVTARRFHPLWAALTMLAATAASAGVLMAAGIATFAAIVGVVGLLAILTGVFREPPLVRGIVPGYAILLPGLLLSGRLNSSSEVPIAAYVLPLLAAYIPLLHFLFPRNRRLAWRIALHGGILAAVLGAAGGLALLAESPATPAESETDNATPDDPG
ncbi:MAG: hypothetical protein ACJ8F7_00805 [Gemmataceae bacterium]